MLPQIFYAFKGAENITTTRVLTAQIGIALLPEAIAVLESSRLQSRSWASIQGFAIGHLHQRRSLPKSLTLDYAIPIGKFYTCVDEFTRLITLNALTKLPFGGPDISNPTYGETCRFQRACTGSKYTAPFLPT
jgi:hypothetical protein